MTALPLHRKFVKATENYFFAGFPRKRLVTLSESKKHIPISFFFFFLFLARGFLLQTQTTTKVSTSLFFLSEAEIFHWDCDGWNAWGIWMRVISIRGEVNETQEDIEVP